MKISEIVCDRCGKRKEVCTKADSVNASAMLKLWGVGEYRGNPPQRIDLCCECYEEFISFLEKGGALID